MSKNYCFLYDIESGEFKGLSRDNPQPSNSTHVEPHFESGYKTIFDRNTKVWKLIKRDQFFEIQKTAHEMTVHLDEYNRKFDRMFQDQQESLILGFEQMNDKFSNLKQDLILLKAQNREYEVQFKKLSEAIESNKEKQLESNKKVLNAILGTFDEVQRVHLIVCKKRTFKKVIQDLFF